MSDGSRTIVTDQMLDKISELVAEREALEKLVKGMLRDREAEMAGAKWPR